MLMCLWEVETGKYLQVLEGHLGPVYTVCFAPNGKYLVAVPPESESFAILGC
jgi:WD40 repeat protein